MLNQAVDRHGRVDVLVNNAGVSRPAALQDTDEASFDFHYRINQLGVFLGMEAVVASMSAAKGESCSFSPRTRAATCREPEIQVSGGLLEAKRMIRRRLEKSGLSLSAQGLALMGMSDLYVDRDDATNPQALEMNFKNFPGRGAEDSQSNKLVQVLNKGKI